MSLISEKITKDIQDKKITPSPRWHFLLKNYGVLTVFILSIVCGSVVVSTILFMIDDYDRDVFQKLDRGFLNDVVMSVPYLWIVILFIFILIANYGFEKTYTGYKYEMYKIILLSLALSVAIGTGLFYIGLDSEVDEFISQEVPFYETLIYNKDDIWIFPERGLLSGRVVNPITPNRFILEDFNNKIWQVNEVGPESINPMIIQSGFCIRLVGKQIDDNTFNASIIRLWNRFDKYCEHILR